MDTADKYPEMMTVTLDLIVSPNEKPRGTRKLPWDDFPVEKLTPKLLFSSKEEIQQTFAEFGNNDSTLLLNTFYPIPLLPAPYSYTVLLYVPVCLSVHILDATVLVKKFANPYLGCILV